MHHSEHALNGWQPPPHPDPRRADIAARERVRARRDSVGLLVALLVAGLSSAPLGAAPTAAEATLAVDVHASGTQPWQRLNDTHVAALAARLERAFVRAGFGHVTPRWCAGGSCAAGAGTPHLALDVTLAEARAGDLKRGIAIDLGSSNPRDAGRIRGTLLEVSCRLRTPGGRLVAARDSDEPVPDRLASGGTIDGDYLGQKIADACTPLLAEQQVVLVAPLRGPAIITTADPEVYIEKREVAAAAALPAVLDARPVTDPAATADAPMPAATTSTSGAADGNDAAAAGAALTLSREGAGKRTQYVLHNKGDTVYLEFGRRR
ncbi:MAG: hypothetical protein RLW62_22730 [Gammaproteobacteria bacterium]